MQKLTLLTMIFFGSQLMAQTPALPQLESPIPRKLSFAKQRSFHLKSNPMDVDALAGDLKRQFEDSLKPLEQGEPSCKDSSAEDAAKKYVLALQVSGQLEACSSFAKRCQINPLVVATGSSCELDRDQLDKADALLTLATDAKFKASPDYDAALVLLAVFKFSKTGEDPDLSLNLSPNLSSETKKLLRHVVLELGRYKDGSMSVEDTRDQLKQEIAKQSTYLGDLLKFFLIRFDVLKYLHAESVEDLMTYAPSLSNPMLWYSLAYNTLYHGLDQDFARAQMIYDVYDSYSHAWWSFPTEQNTYNYTEIYSSVCKNTLLQGASTEKLRRIKSNWRDGKATVAESLAAAEKLNQDFPGKADVLATYASLLAMSDRHEEAKQNYWQSHRACRYFNRANWGLVLEARHQRFIQSPNYEGNTARVERELKDVTIPASISKFFLNWSALSPDSQRRVEYGSRIWLPFMDTLSRNSFSAYIKMASELLSEAPGMESIRDQRIGGDGYPNDNRLWDDVRGLGGESVVADLNEVYQTVQGDYNLLGHEMSHQFEYLLQNIYPEGEACIAKIYNDTKANGTFPDGYSAQNKEEHFAQGVTYYLIPEDAPANFGTNRTWVKTNAPEQFRFIESIVASGGDFDKISCSN